MAEILHRVKASTFADPNDVRSFRKWKAIYIEKGFSEQEAEVRAFAKGDNGIGFWEDDTTEGSGPSCALPPEDMWERWIKRAIAKHKLVRVSTGDKTVDCVLKDTMPLRKNIHNGCGIDLNPDAARALNYDPPAIFSVTWQWIV